MPKGPRGGSRGGSRGGNRNSNRNSNRNRNRNRGGGGGNSGANNSAGGNLPPPVAPVQTPPTFLEKIGGGLGSGIRHAATGTLGQQLGGSLEKGLTGGRTSGDFGGAIGAGGAVYGLGKLLGYAYDTYSSKQANKANEPKKLVEKPEQKYRDEAKKNIMGGLTSFDQRALDIFTNQQDEGWNMGIKSMKPDAYKQLAVEAIKSGDASRLWNEAVLAAKAKGKTVNASKPVYLPQRFSKGGKEYAYAIDPSQTAKGGKPRLISIKIGGGIEWGDEQSK